MKNKLTIPLIVLASIGLTYVVATLVLTNFLSEERLRLMLVEPAEVQLGRKVDIGFINVSLFSGINLGNITVHGKDGGKDLLSIDDFRLSYRLLPLLEKRLVITEILIDHPTLNLSRNDKGVFNFSDLSLTPKKVEKENLPPGEVTVEPLPLNLVFDKITVDNADLTFIDKTGRLPEIISTDGNLDLSLALADKLSESKYQGTLRLIVNAAYSDHKPVLIMGCDFNREHAGFKGDLNIEFERIVYNGQLVNLFSKPELTLNLQSNSLNLNKLLDIPRFHDQTTPPAVKPTAPDPPPGAIPTGDPAVAAETAQAPDAPTAAESKNIIAHGQIAIVKIEYDELDVKNLNLNYSFKRGQLALNDVNLEIFDGQVNGQLKSDLRQLVPNFQGDFKADGLEMDQAMADLGKPSGYLSGKLSANMAFRATGKSWPEIRNTLDGDGRFSLVKGGLADSPYSRALATILDIPELNELKFDELAGTMRIAEGRVALLCTISSPEFGLQSKGIAGLDGSLDLPLTIHLSRQNSRRLLEKSKFAGYLADESGRTTLNLKLTGTVEQPQLTMDRGGAGRQVKNALEKKAGEELNRALEKQLGGKGNEQQKGVAEDLSNRFLKQMLDN